MDVIFVNPNARAQIYQSLSGQLAAVEVPVWCGLLANNIRSKGFRTAIYDAEAEQTNAAQSAAAIMAFKPKLVVLVVYGQQPSASTQNMPGAIAIASELLAIDANISVLALGTHPSALPKETLAEGPFTFVCQGEGMDTITGLLTSLHAGKQEYAQIPGLCWKDGANIVLNKTAALAENLDNDLPGIAWDLLDMSKYRAHNWHCFDDVSARQPYASLPTSLGCPYKCSFCCINAPFGKSGIRYWSTEFIAQQIDLLVNTYGIRNIKIPDEMFILNEKHILGICDHIIEKKYDLNIWAYARVDTIKEKYLPKLKAAGFHWLALGIESSSKFVRDGVTKGRFTNENIKEIVKKVQSYGIAVCGNYIFGLPDDTAESMQETLSLALDLNTEWANFYCAMAYPGSALYTQALRENIPLPQSWIAYSQHSYECFPLPTKFLSNEQVLKFRDFAFESYFRSNEYIECIINKFGPKTAEHIEEMLQIKIRRKLLEKPIPKISQENFSIQI